MRNFLESMYQKLNYKTKQLQDSFEADPDIGSFAYHKHSFDDVKKAIHQLPKQTQFDWPKVSKRHVNSFNDILVALQQPNLKTMQQALAVVRRETSTNQYYEFVKDLIEPIERYTKAKTTNKVILNILHGVQFGDNVEDGVMKLHQRVLPMLIEPLFKQYDKVTQEKIRVNYERLMVEYSQGMWTRKYFSLNYAEQLKHRQALIKKYQDFDTYRPTSYERQNYFENGGTLFGYLNNQMFEKDQPMSNELIRWVTQQLFKDVFDADMSELIQMKIHQTHRPQQIVEWYLIWATLHQYHKSSFMINWDEYLKINLDIDMSQYEQKEQDFDMFSSVGIEQPELKVFNRLKVYEVSFKSYSINLYQHGVYPTQMVAYQRLDDLLGVNNPLNRIDRLMADKYLRKLLKQHDNQSLNFDSVDFTDADLLTNATTRYNSDKPMARMWLFGSNQLTYSYFVEQNQDFKPVLLSDIKLLNQINQLKQICHLQARDETEEESPC